MRLPLHIIPLVSRFLARPLAALAAFLLLAAAPAAAEEVVAEFNDSKSTTTRDFHVEGPWLLDWRLYGDFDQLVALHVWLIDADTGFSEGRILRRETRGDGLRLFEEGGHYRLRISSTLARWTIRVVQLTPEEAERYTPRETGRLPPFSM